MALPPITHLLDKLDGPAPFRGQRSGESGAASLVENFSSILSENLGGLVETTQDAARLQRDFAAGKTDNIHEVMIAGAKANLAVETALQVRNLALRAYQTLSQLR